MSASNGLRPAGAPRRRRRRQRQGPWLRRCAAHCLASIPRVSQALAARILREAAERCVCVLVWVVQAGWGVVSRSVATCGRLVCPPACCTTDAPCMPSWESGKRNRQPGTSLPGGEPSGAEPPGFTQCPQQTRALINRRQRRRAPGGTQAPHTPNPSRLPQCSASERPIVSHMHHSPAASLRTPHRPHATHPPVVSAKRPHPRSRPRSRPHPPPAPRVLFPVWQGHQGAAVAQQEERSLQGLRIPGVQQVRGVGGAGPAAALASTRRPSAAAPHLRGTLGGSLSRVLCSARARGCGCRQGGGSGHRPGLAPTCSRALRRRRVAAARRWAPPLT